MILETREYDAETLLERLPHRYENVLLDHVDYQRTPTEISGNLSVQIDSDTDPRALFLQECIPGQFSIIPTALMEILALASVSCTDYEAGSLIIFASMSNFEVYAPAPGNAPILGTVVKLKDKGNFLRCRGDLRTADGVQIAQGDLMAFIIESDALSTQPNVPAKQLPRPPLTIDIPTPKSEFKKNEVMVVCDALRHVDLAEGIVVGEYTYPDNHPLIKGHFPENPIMMGIMQLLGLEDTLNTAVNAQLLPPSNWQADADIIRDDGALIAEVKGATFAVNSPVSVTTTGTKKMVFRDPVRPGDKFYVVIRELKTL